VVDDAIIDVENIIRRLRENRRLPRPRPVARVVLDACLEVRSAVVYATFAVVLVVLPILALSGLAGRLFAPLGLSYMLAFTPALSMALLARRNLSAKDPPLIRWTQASYETVLRAAAQRPRMLIAGAVAITVAGCAALPFFSSSFIPELQEGHFIIHMSALPGTSIDESLRIGARVSDKLRQLPFVQSVAQRVGRAEKAFDTWGTHYSEFEVDLKPLSGEEAEEVQGEIRKALSSFLGVNFSVKTFLTERVEETLSGYTAAVAINVFGNDLDILDQKAQEIARLLGEVEGATDVQVQSPPGLPQLTIRLRKPDLERWGFDAVEVLDLVRAAYQGDVVGQTYEGNQVFNVITILDEESRSHVTKVGGLPLRSPGGSYVLLKQLADVYESSGHYQVLHEGARRLQTVTANVAGSDVASFVRMAQAAIAAKVELPAGTYLQFAGTAEAQAQSQRDLTVNALIAGVSIILLLSIITRNWRNLLLVLANLPFALVGGVLAVFATGGVLSLGGMVGFITLLGITLRNSILMIAHYERLVEAEGMTWGLDTAVRGARDRLTPRSLDSVFCRWPLVWATPGVRSRALWRL
jgi:Cu/Ag efflux pump CusA